MNRIDRLQAILVTLQSRRVVKAEEIARKFDISVRTVYRDIRALEEGGVPIGAEAGIGYYMIDGYYLPPVMFSIEEARALLIGAKLLEKLSDKSMNESFQNALTKVRAVLDKEKKEEIEDLEGQILVEPFPNNRFQLSENPVLNEIESALVGSNVLECDYYSNYKSEFTRRKIEPIGLCYYANQWHLFGYCLLREDYRDFRVDRMSKVNILSERFKKHQHPSLQEYVDNLVKSTELIRTVVLVKKDAARYISDAKYKMGLLDEEDQGEWIQMTFGLAGVDYFARWLLMMGNNVKIVSPESLILKHKTLVREISDAYL